MSDLIDRQTAIDALQEKVFHNLSDEFYGTMQVLNELPSAQPEIITCKDCKHTRHCGPGKAMCQNGKIHELDWYCANGERREQCD